MRKQNRTFHVLRKPDIFTCYEQALEKAHLLAENSDMRLLAACLKARPTSEVEALSGKVRGHVVSDPEIRYWTAGIEALCGRNEDAFELLRQAVTADIAPIPPWTPTLC